MSSSVVGKVPAGAHRGRHPLDLTVGQLEEAVSYLEAKLCSGHEYKDANSHKRWLREATRLLQQRKFPTGSFTETSSANRALRDAAEVGHLVSPSQQLAALIDGCALMISACRFDSALDTFADDDDPRRRVPGKSMLDRLAGELGVSMLTKDCKRTDDHRSPYVRGYQAAGRVRQFDLSWRELQAHAEIDLTNGSALIRKLDSRINDVRRSRLEIERRRAFITSHADTAARLRLLRGLGGLRESYLPSDLDRPFFVARIAFTGQSDNPATKARFDATVAEAFVPSVAALYEGPKRAGGER